MCPSASTMASRSFVDVYTNGVMTNAPMGSCCCCWCDRLSFVIGDDKRISSMGVAGQPGPTPSPGVTKVPSACDAWIEKNGVAMFVEVLQCSSAWCTCIGGKGDINKCDKEAGCNDVACNAQEQKCPPLLVPALLWPLRGSFLFLPALRMLLHGMFHPRHWARWRLR